MSRENYSSEPEEFIASLKEKLEEKEEEIRELKQVNLLQKGVLDNQEITIKQLQQLKQKIIEYVEQVDSEWSMYNVEDMLPKLQQLIQGD